ncbi:MAG: cupin domain-containing protein [Gemmatimonadetes bacterium]|nr:cupin domain-containing protein [Gemmatimonadota bacterium]MYB67663.1 cupin domain-containing protein [Gemmatimonadota bacterium]
MKRIRHVRLDELDPRGGPVFEGLRRQTPWEAFDYWALAPGEERSVPGTGMACEQGYVFTGGPLELTVRQQRVESGEGPGFIVESTGSAHELKNLTDIPVQVLRVRVAMDVDAETQQRHVNQFWEQFLGVKSDAMQGIPLLKGTFDTQELKWRDAIHGGCGQIATRHVIPPRNFYSDWTFLDHAILSEKGSLGYHHHEALEESFVVLKGRGLMKIEDEIFEVGPGSVTWQGIEQRHSLSNPGPEKLEFVRIAVRQAYTTIDV